MKLSEMFTLLNTYVDDIVAPATATTLFNVGQNKMAAEIKASFPLLVSTIPDSTLAFDQLYHEIPVLYAAAMIKAQDSSIREKGSYLEQFKDALNSFTENYDVPARYKNNINIQQFVATASQTKFIITKDTYTTNYSNLKVYVNDLITTNFTTNASDLSFTLTTASTLNDAVTAIWTVNDDFQEPPYPWMTW